MYTSCILKHTNTNFEANHCTGLRKEVKMLHYTVTYCNTL